MPEPTSTPTRKPKPLDPRLLEVRRRSRWGDLVLSVGILIALIAATAWIAGQGWGTSPRNHALIAGVITLIATMLGHFALMLPVNALNFVALVYLGMLVRMAIGLLSLVALRLLWEPGFAIDTIGFTLAFYGIGLLLETILVVRGLKSPGPGTK